MKRLLLVFLLLLAIATGAVIALRDRAAEAIVARTLALAQTMASRHDMQLTNVRFETASFSGFGAIAVHGLRGELRMEHGVLQPGPEALRFEFADAMAEIRDLWEQRGEIVALGGTLVVLDGEGRPTGERARDVRIEAAIDFDIGHIERVAAKLEDQIRDLLRDGRSRLDARISCVVRFRVRERWHEAALRSKSEAGETVLLLERNDVRAIASEYPQKLTDAEVELVARHPTRAPALLRLSEQASRTAREWKARDASFPTDAFRHVYWSWLLTREFGPDFAEEVTDAHEIDPTYEFGEGNRQMDLHNNAIGRSYAEAGVEEDDLVARVRSDPEVIRSASELPLPH